MSRVAMSLITALVCITPVMAGLFRVWVHQDVVQLGYRLSVAEKNRRVLISDLEQLEVEAAAAKSPKRLSMMARELNMVQPTASAIAGVSSSEGPDVSR